jgi:predicted Zn-dependent peptidase
VVIQEINRAYDQPATVAEYLIDRAAFGEHPLGRTVLGPEQNLRSFTREGIVAFRERRWAGACGGVFLAGNLEHLPDEPELHEAFARFPALAEPEPYAPVGAFAPQTLVEQRDTNQSHLRMIYRPEIAVSDVRQRAALAIYSTLLGGSMGSRLFEEIREKRGLCYSVYAIDHEFADVPVLQLGSGLESAKCVEAYQRMREIVDELRADGPTEEEVARARAYAAGRMVLAFENTGAVARYAANQRIVFGQDIDPDAAIAALDAVTFEEVREVAAGVADHLAVACVGPHATEEF